MMFGSAYADMRLVPYRVRHRLARDPLQQARPICRWRATRASSASPSARADRRRPPLSLAIAANDQTAQARGARPCPDGRAAGDAGRAATAATLGAAAQHAICGAMAIVRRHGFSNDQWAIEGANLLIVRYRAAPAVSGRSVADRPAAHAAAGRDAGAIDRALRRLPARRVRLSLADRPAAVRPGAGRRPAAGLARTAAPSSIGCRRHDRAVDRRSLLQRGSVPRRAAPAADRRGARRGRRGL